VAHEGQFHAFAVVTNLSSSLAGGDAELEEVRK
jgi:hypothetical protein